MIEDTEAENIYDRSHAGCTVNCREQPRILDFVCVLTILLLRLVIVSVVR